MHGTFPALPHLLLRSSTALHCHAMPCSITIACSVTLGPGISVVQEGINRYVFGEGLNPLEQEWLAAVINEHLGGFHGLGRAGLGWLPRGGQEWLARL